MLINAKIANLDAVVHKADSVLLQRVLAQSFNFLTTCESSTAAKRFQLVAQVSHLYAARAKDLAEFKDSYVSCAKNVLHEIIAGDMPGIELVDAALADILGVFPDIAAACPKLIFYVLEVLGQRTQDADCSQRLMKSFTTLLEQNVWLYNYFEIISDEETVQKFGMLSS